MFNLSAGEIVVMVLLGVIFLGPSKLPDLAANLMSVSPSPRWSGSDWALVIAALLSFCLACATLISVQR